MTLDGNVVLGLCDTLFESHPYQFFFLSFYYRRVPLNFFVVEMADSHLISPSQLYTRVHSGETRSSPLRYDDMSTIFPPTSSPLIAPVRKRRIPTSYFLWVIKAKMHISSYSTRKAPGVEPRIPKIFPFPVHVIFICFLKDKYAYPDGLWTSDSDADGRLMM